MPPTDYAVLPDGDIAEGKEERRAELVLSKLADRLVMTSRAPVLVIMVVSEVSLVFTGLWLRTYLVPHGWDYVVPWAVLAVIALAAPSVKRRKGQAEPRWHRAADAHERYNWPRLPTETRIMLHEFTRSMTAATRWRGDAHVYIAPCTEDEGTPHYAACCTGGTMILNGRLLVVVGEHLAMGDPGAARAVLGHERGHISGWRLYAYALAAITGTWGLVLVGWMITPWWVMLLIAVDLRLARVGVAWVVELACDVRGALAASPEAMVAALDFKRRTQGEALALRPRGQQLALRALSWLAAPEHPSYKVRRTVIRRMT
jgi:hypothetical protein